MGKVVKVHLRVPHEKQRAFIESKAKRIVMRAGRRSGKTTAVAQKAVRAFIEGHRVLYATPTGEQAEKFWYEVTSSMEEVIRAGGYRKNEVERSIDRIGTENRLKAKTAWNADTLRGDYADRLFLDEFQLMNEDTWGVVGAPMMADHNGDAAFVYTPPSPWSSGVSKARDPLHATRMRQRALADKTGMWEVFDFTTLDNPYLDEEGVRNLVSDMSRESYRREILAEDDEENPGRLVYGAFEEATCRIPRFPMPVSWPRYVGHDFGGANPAALFIAQDPATGFFYACHEYLPGRGLSTSQHVQKFKEIADGQIVIKRVGGSHQEDEVRQGYASQGWPIQEPAVRAVNAQIDRVRGVMERNKLFVFNDMVHLLHELMTCSWKTDADGHIMNEIDNKAAFHLLDALRYILSDFTPEMVVWETVSQFQDMRPSHRLLLPRAIL